MQTNKVMIGWVARSYSARWMNSVNSKWLNRRCTRPWSSLRPGRWRRTRTRPARTRSYCRGSSSAVDRTTDIKGYRRATLSFIGRSSRLTLGKWSHKEIQSSQAPSRWPIVTKWWASTSNSTKAVSQIAAVTVCKKWHQSNPTSKAMGQRLREDSWWSCSRSESSSWSKENKQIVKICKHRKQLMRLLEFSALEIKSAKLNPKMALNREAKAMDQDLLRIDRSTRWSRVPRRRPSTSPSRILYWRRKYWNECENRVR